MTGENTLGITILHDPTADAIIKDKSCPPDRVLFDLVAIHGLNGDAIETWTHKKTRVMWLRDLLPEAIPNIRIMTFGYNARFKNFTAQQDLRSISIKLLAELSDSRTTQEEKSRPIILVCHSLGGIVAKKALLIGCSEDQEQVQQSVSGIFFLGTPHNGSSLAAMGKLLANVVSACTPIRPPRAILGTLQKDSQVLLEITEDFIKRRKKVHVVCFYELELTTIGPFLKTLVVEQQSAILNLPDEITIPQFADHRNLVRFKSLQDRCFRPVVSRLKELAREVHSSSTTQTLSSQESDSAVLFDVPTLPCSSFCGREDVLGIMNSYFHDSRGEGQERRTFALCGLGGSGKTQTALHYLLRNISRYRTAVAFLNASSETSLTADFDRLHDLLRLGESRNKVSAVRTWLSKPENSRWLLVFDNADNLDSTPIRKYIPAVNWGDILITSRDQAVIGSIAERGYVLISLTTKDAIQLLLEKSGIQNPGQADMEEARKIAELLGCLPLALVQAGAFIRSRRKSLADYNRLYMTHQEDLLRFSIRLADTDQAVLTAWEINFKQVEQESIEATHLLLLFSFLEPSSIQEVVLHRGTSAQKRWGKNGEVIEITPQDEGVDEFLVKIIQGDLEFDMAIEKLLSFSLISCNRESNGLRNFSIHPLVQYCAMRRLPPSEVDRWRWQALLLVCHAFPRNRYIEPLNGEIGRMLLPHLGRVLGDYDAICIKHGEQPNFVHELASTLLAASRFSTAKWKAEAISRTKTLLEDDKDPYMNAWLAYRESAIARMSGKVAESEDALQRFLRFSTTLSHEDFELDPRFNAQRGDLIISFSENLIRQGKLIEAKKELIEWKPLGRSQSTLEGITLRARDITLGKVLRYQGLFQEARTLLEGVLQNSVLDGYFEGTGWYRVLLSNVADLYCELGLPASAEKLVMQELSPMRERGTQDIATGRRLQMSLAETYLQRHMYAKAESLLLDLRRAFTSSDGPDYTSDINIFRIWILLARISHAQSCWDECLTRWKHALSVLERLNLDRSFNSGLVRCSIADVLLMTGHNIEAADMLQKARVDMISETRIFWIPLFNSQWHDSIVDRLKIIEG